MQNERSYVVFATAWGYFGLAAANKTLYRTCLPMDKVEEVKGRLLQDIQGRPRLDKNLFLPLQAAVRAYFAGERTDLNLFIPLALEEMTDFSRAVLMACAAVPLGEATDYASLASRAGSPQAARAVGNALARNPVPLIIPCHRIVARSGLIGGFSGAGGMSMKKRLLQHEAKMLAQ